MILRPSPKGMASVFQIEIMWFRDPLDALFSSDAQKVYILYPRRSSGLTPGAGFLCRSSVTIAHEKIDFLIFADDTIIKSNVKFTLSF